jgi:DNA-binding LytR/AlgR family response regulator
MKVRIEVEEDLVEDEIIIKCRSITNTIQKVQQTISDITSSTQKLSFFKDGKEYYLSLNLILFFETSDNGVYAHTPDDVYKVKYKLYELEEILPRNFLRVSKSTILNINHILSISSSLTSLNTVEFNKSYKRVYVSRFYFKSLKNRLDERRNYEKK